MEVKEAERLFIAKPVASRPSGCSAKSFTELLAGAINTPPPSFAETTLPIRPKTVRFKPNMASPQVSGTSVSFSSEKNPQEEKNSTLVYKPLAKLVSKTTMVLLANLGDFDGGHHQEVAQVQSQFQTSEKLDNHIQVRAPSNPCQRVTSQEENQRLLLPSTSGNRSSYDGYNWRKYGQKQVKEIVYKGEHNHPKPNPPKRLSSGALDQAFPSEETQQDNGTLLWSNSLPEMNEGSDSIINSQSDLSFSTNTNYSGKTPFLLDSIINGGVNGGEGGRTPDNSCGISADCEEVSRVDGDDEQPNSKRRKSEDVAIAAGEAVQGIQQTQVVVQTSLEPEIIGDGFRWRKYGQKIVKGNPYPRSYYRCTSLKCNVRKHVERASDDPKAFITTYEGNTTMKCPVPEA